MLREPVPCSQGRCKHYRGVIQPDGTEATERDVCAAFPAGIPVEITTGKNPHTAPYPGDHGIRYEPLPGARAALLDLLRACGGPGSGVPGPCPEGGGDDGGDDEGTRVPKEVRRDRAREDRRTEAKREREESAIDTRARKEVEREHRGEEKVIDRRQEKESAALDAKHEAEEAAGTTTVADRGRETRELIDRHQREKDEWYNREVEPKVRERFEKLMAPVRERWAKEDEATAAQRAGEDRARAGSHA